MKLQLISTYYVPNTIDLFETIYSNILHTLVKFIYLTPDKQ